MHFLAVIQIWITCLFGELAVAGLALLDAKNLNNISEFTCVYKILTNWHLLVWWNWMILPMKRKGVNNWRKCELRKKNNPKEKCSVVFMCFGKKQRLFLHINCGLKGFFPHPPRRPTVCRGRGGKQGRRGGGWLFFSKGFYFIEGFFKKRTERQRITAMFCGCKSVQLVAVFYSDLASCLECRNGRSRGEQDGAPATPWCKTTPPKWSMFYVPSPWQPVPDLIYHRFWASNT